MTFRPVERSKRSQRRLLVEDLEARTLLSSGTTVIGTTLDVVGVKGAKAGAIIAGFATITPADPNATAADFQATIDWGDGASSSAGVVASPTSPGFVVVGGHRFAQAGTFSVVVTTTDSSGTATTAQSTVNVQFPSSSGSNQNSGGGTTGGTTSGGSSGGTSSGGTTTPTTPPDATQTFLLTPVPETGTLAEHIHPHLTILINGQAQTIPANIGFINGFLPIHTHNDSLPGETFKRIHIESPAVRTFHLRDFFTVWQKTFNDPNIVFNSQNILGNQVDATHQITMTVNGQPSTDFENLVLQDNGTLFDTDQPGTTDPRVQDIVISYGPR